MKFEQYRNMSDKRKLEEIDQLVLNKKIWSSGTSFNDEEKLEHIGRILHQPMKKTDEEKLDAIVDRINFWKHKEATAEDFSIFFKEIKAILEK